MGNYFYFIGITLLLPLWIRLFIKRDHRKDMLIIGTLFGVEGTIMEHLYAKNDYWNPVYLFSKFPFEDFYYGFIFGGISSELYSLVFNTINSEIPVYKSNKKWIVIFSIITLSTFVILTNVLNINSIVSHIVLPLFVGFIIMFLRKDLIKLQIFNGIFVTIITIIMFYVLLLINPNLFKDNWILENLTSIYFLKIPIEELIFSFALGFGAGGVYEFIYGYKEIKQNKV